MGESNLGKEGNGNSDWMKGEDLPPCPDTLITAAISTSIGAVNPVDGAVIGDPGTIWDHSGEAAQIITDNGACVCVCERQKGSVPSTHTKCGIGSIVRITAIKETFKSGPRNVAVFPWMLFV